MSRSSTSPRFSLAFGTERSVGVVIGRDRVTAVCLSGRAASATVEWTRTRPAAADLFGDGAGDAAIPALRAAFAELLPEARNAFIPLHVALPDPLGTIAVLEFDSLPKSAAQCRQLVEWRLRSELGLPERGLEVAYQNMAASEAKQLLFVQALPSDWLNAIKEALSGAGLVPWSMNQTICYRVNQYHPQLLEDKAPGALLALDDDAWTVAIWDAALRPRFIRSRWRPRAARVREQEFDAITEDFERMVLAYVHGGTQRAIQGVYLTADDEDCGPLAVALNRRLHAPCRVLDQGAGLQSGGSSAAIARLVAEAA